MNTLHFIHGYVKTSHQVI